MLLMIVLLGAGGLLAFVLASYSRFVRQRQLVTESWRQVDVELRRRADLLATLARQPPSLALPGQLAETEDRIAAARRFYNANVRAYNTRLALLPQAFAARTSFTPARYFEVDETVRSLPDRPSSAEQPPLP
jgi:LemA protein